MGASTSMAHQDQTTPPHKIDLLSINEEAQIGNCIDSVLDHGLKRDPEVIVVDGGSSDNTIKISKHLGARVVSSARGRGRQLNTGWKVSQGDWLLFLHADSRLPVKYGSSMNDAISRNPRSTWGSFHSIQTDVDGWSMRLVTLGVQLRTRVLGMPYGDQAFFVKASTMEKLKGFKNVRLMEDVDFVQRAKREGFGRPILLPQPVFTSGRRWKQHGVWKTTAMNHGILLAHFLGVEPDTLADWYYSKRRS